MSALTISDLNNGKQDLKHIEALATSAELTAQDRFGNTKSTLAGVLAKIPDSGVVGYPTLASLNADLTRPAQMVAFVTNDPTPSNNGTYRKEGPVGAGAWVAAADLVSALDVAGPLAIIDAAVSITVDLAGKRIIVDQAGVVMHRRGYTNIPAGQNVAFAYTSPNYLMYLYAHRITGALAISEVSTGFPPVGSVVLGYIFGQKLYAEDRAGRILVLPTAPNVAGGRLEDTGTFISEPGGLSLNMKTKRITTDAQGGSIAYRGGFVAVAGSQNVAFNWTYGGGVGWLFVNPKTGAVGMTDLGASPPTGFPIIGMTWKNEFYSQSDNRCIKFFDGNGTPRRCKGLSGDDVSLGVVSLPLGITINLASKTVSTTAAGTAGIVMNGGDYVAVPGGQVVAFIQDDPNFLVWVYVERSTGTVGVIAATDDVPANVVPIAAVYQQRLYAIDPYQKIVLYGADGRLVPRPGVLPFNEAEHRLILPDDMYFWQHQPMVLFKARCFSTNDSKIMGQIQLWLDTKGTDLSDRYQCVGELLKLNASQLGASFELGFRHDSVPAVRYLQPIARHMAAPDALGGKSFRYLAIGDSLTEVGMVAANVANLAAHGAVATPVGTYASGYTEGLRGEGRGFWNYRSFIGKDNYSADVGAHTRSPGGKTDTGKFENPFLKLADANDKANHPTWCFRFTGVDREVSYAEAADKTGNFYIFDFAWYMVQHSVPAPDVITIALSTNDINLDNSSYNKAERLQYMRLGLQVMVRQIKAALPNVTIGVIPAPGWSSTAMGDAVWQDETSAWIEQCQADVRALQGEFQRLYVVPVWPFMSTDWAYPYDTSVALSPVNRSQRRTIVDWVHFDSVGRQQYVQVVGAWMANVL